MASSSFPSSSSSSSSVPPRGPWAYDVFLSFRGEDTRNNFVDHLYEALDRNGLTVFKDDKMLRVGKEISPELMKAIQESTCTVVVFSKNYANSSWCLAELTKVMECHNQKNGRLVIPVFYHVNPTDVRGQKRSFEIAFKQHEEKFKEEMDEVKKWREVLQSAANLSGYHISKEQAEASFITKIVRDIQGNKPFRGMEKDHIGIVSHINKLKLLLDLEATEEVRMIGIWGMGGIGKTTIARALFRKICYDFNGSSFVKDVREKYSNGRDICVLQKQIVKQIAHNVADIEDVEEGTEMIRKIFHEKKILLVLDDVDAVRQLEVLGAIPEWFGKGSRIIITTRDCEFLADANGVYRPDLLPKEHAVELFSWHAFRKNSPPEGYEDLSNRAIGYTRGLPLALRVLGCFFHGKRDTDEWESHLNRLDQAKNNGSLETPFTHEKNGIMETFKISFDGLYEYEKNIFLDIACFFKGQDQKDVTEILDCSGLDSVETGIKALIRKSLITVSDEQINMHDVLQEMGLEIVRKSYPNTRLCRTEEIRCLEKNNNLETVTGIVQIDHDDWVSSRDVHFSGDVFESMNNLRLLQTRGFFTSCEPTTFPEKLGWLDWTRYPFSSLPVANMRKLVRLEMHQGKINHLWSGYEYMPKLKSISLGVMNNITSLPDVSGAVNLKKLELFMCNNLVEIHKSLGTLKNLAYLKFHACIKVRYLPSLEEMPALDTIDLTGCIALERFPEVSSSMVRLSNIHLDGCSNLKNIPNSICKLKNLEILNLQSCGSLQDLPEELGSMGKLEELLLGFEYIPWSNLPDSINLHALTKLCCLRKLDLSGRQMEEQDFPKNFHEFSSLKELNLSGNLKLVQLPGSISRLSSLTHLELNDCEQLQNIQGLPSGIQVLKASNCIALEKIEEWTYDVFLSFGGEDTRNNFVDHLHASLVQKGIRVFTDYEMLRRGKPISSEFLKAIEESRFAVVVFSENYANSSWCLDELTKIMECQDRIGQKVLPVFYHVDPSDVRGQKREFAMAFQKHEEKFREEVDKVNKWRKALAAAANLSGWHISTVNGDVYLVINKIVQKIWDDTPSYRMENNLIGIESRIDKLNSLLGTEETHKVRMVGICGMGGIGKTTIARALFRRISYKFDGSSFVKDVREKSRRDICALQKQILEDVLAMHHESKIEDPEDGAEIIQKRFRNKKVLLVLDDVDDEKQLEFLAATHEWFGAGSRIIITTRNEHLLSDTNANYKPALFVKEQAVELFSRHAFRKNSPPEGYEELSNRVIGYAGGLPLALTVLGSYLYGREVGVWESAINRLAKTPNIEIFEKLKISFDGLEDYEKTIFLDIACFFKGRDEEEVTRILDSFRFDAARGIRTLIEKSLITISSKRINMHGLLQEMGLEIVRKSYPNSRLGKCEEIHDFISKNSNLEAVEAIVPTYIDEGMCVEIGGFSNDAFKNMKNIRLLDISHNFTSTEPTFLPDELRWLRWYQYPFSSLPVSNLHKLVGLEIAFGKIEHLWKGYKFMPSLKFVHLEWLRCKSFPDVSGAPNVERLTLSDCTKLVEVHESLGTLRKLVYLNMSGCSNLKCIPSMIEMESLETVDLSDCLRLKKFPEVSSRMEKLSKIYLDGCSSLKIISSSICELKSLTILNLHDCMQLKELPKGLGSFAKLEELQLGLGAHNMVFQRQPDSINFQTLTTLFCLRKLDLSLRPIENKDFLNGLDGLSSLEELHLSGNSKLVELPASISRLSHLKHLELNDCQQLVNIQGLPLEIQVLKACDCMLLETIEDLAQKYLRLYKIWLPGCETLLDDAESERHLNEMLCQSFLEKCAAVDNVLSIAVPGSKIPSWFQDQRHGKQIALKFPPERRTDILGFAVCGVMHRKWQRGCVQIINTSEIHFTVGNDNRLIRVPKVDDIKASAVATEDKNVWVVYIPFSLFQEQMYNDFGGEDGFLFAQGNLIINIVEPKDGYTKIVRCGAHIMYKEDVESIQSIPDYKNSNLVRRLDDSFTYIEKFRNIDLQSPM